MLYDDFEIRKRPVNPYIADYLSKAGLAPQLQPNVQSQLGANPFQEAAKNNHLQIVEQGRQQQAQNAGLLGQLEQGSGLLGDIMANSSQNDFVNKLQTAATNVYPDNPLMQQLAMTTALLESGGLSGKPNQLLDANNLFSIKASKDFPGTAGNVEINTTEYLDGKPVKIKQVFAKNASLEDSFKQFGDLISGAKRYKNVLQASNPVEAFQEMVKGGYATDPNYANKLEKVFNTYVKSLYS